MYKLCRELQNDKYYLIQTDFELSDLLEYCGIPQEYRQDITGAIVAIQDGEYTEIWLSESAKYYSLDSVYYPISYYTGEK